MAGFGIIFDTFVNAESRQVHKDVALLESDGHESKTAPHGGMNDPQAPGCDANFRYWQGRGDFSPAMNRSAVQITFAVRPDAVVVTRCGDLYFCDAVRVSLRTTHVRVFLCRTTR